MEQKLQTDGIEDLDLGEFQKTVLDELLVPLWIAPPPAEEPESDLQPHLWRWKHLRRRILQAASLIPLGQKGPPYN
jgi:gentisate 1,2-dioxygenase